MISIHVFLAETWSRNSICKRAFKKRNCTLRGDFTNTVSIALMASANLRSLVNFSIRVGIAFLITGSGSIIKKDKNGKPKIIDAEKMAALIVDAVHGFEKFVQKINSAVRVSPKQQPFPERKTAKEGVTPSQSQIPG